MSASTSMRGTASFIAGLLGVVCLFVAANCLVSHIDKLPMGRGPLLLVLGGFLCGGLSLIASWLVYERHPSALAVYAVSWSLNTIGWLALGLAAGREPTWYVYAFGAGLLYLGVFLCIRIRKESAPHVIAP
jgi:hypothetical protein